MKSPIVLAVLGLGGIAAGAGYLWQSGKVDEWRYTGLAECEAYTKAGLRSPSTYKRVSFVVVDTPVSKELLAEARGGSEIDQAMAGIAQAPGIRGVALDYDAQNGFGATVRGAGACYFPMADIKNGDPSGDLDVLARMAETTNLLSRLGVQTGGEQLCCLSPKFDLAKIPHGPVGAESTAAASAAAKDAK